MFVVLISGRRFWICFPVCQSLTYFIFSAGCRFSGQPADVS
jgi:hypothetical protein